MAEERQIGSLELSECLAEDPFGNVYRGQEWVAPRKIREVLVRQYHPIWLDLGLSNRQHEVLRNLVHLGHLKPFKGCHAGRDGSPQLVWPFTPGRSLAQMLKTAEAQGMPVGIDQALFLVWALSHHLRHLHQVNLSPGILTPHRVWIGFDGWVQLLDVPVIGILQELLPSVPSVQDSVQSYLHKPASNDLDFDAFQLGALLFEMLTHRPLPRGRVLASVLNEAQLGTPGMNQGPIPAAIAGLLSRLLGGSEPFRTLEELERCMEDSVFGGDFDPSTFGLAFAMQTLFRQEIAASAMNLSEGTSDPGPGVLADEKKLSSRSSGSLSSRPRRYGLLAAAFLIGGTTVWFGAQAFARKEAAVSTPAQATTSVLAPVQSASATNSLPAARPAPSASNLPVPTMPASETSNQPGPLLAPPASAHPTVSAPVSVSPKGQAVKLRVFVDEEGRVRQVHLVSGAVEGSERERAAFAAAMLKRFTPSQSEGQIVRSWEEITLMVP